MKDKVLKIVKTALGNAQDNLWRAKRSFGHLTQDQMKGEYGNSGQSCAKIQSDYQETVDELEKCVAWVEAQS